MVGRLYFVSHLTEGADQRTEPRFEIQVLDERGRAERIGYLGEDETALILDGEVVPGPVLAATRRLRPGQSAYVDGEGRPAPPV